MGKKKAPKPDEFQQGLLVGVSMFHHFADDPDAAATVLKNMAANALDVSDLDECDKEPLREINREQGMALVGLD